MSERVYCFDIDGTLCTKNCEYSKAKPYHAVIGSLNALYNQGNKIIIMTSRGACSGVDWTEFTTKQLKEWNVKYHELIMNKKPHAHVFIDDRSVNIHDWCISNGLSIE